VRSKHWRCRKGYHNESIGEGWPKTQLGCLYERGGLSVRRCLADVFHKARFDRQGLADEHLKGRLSEIGVWYGAYTPTTHRRLMKRRGCQCKSCSWETTYPNLPARKNPQDGIKTSQRGSLLRWSWRGWSCCSGCSRVTVARGPSLMASGASRCPPVPPACSGGRSGRGGGRSGRSGCGGRRSGRGLCYGLCFSL
jgi:hypothetical protein